MCSPIKVLGMSLLVLANVAFADEYELLLSSKSPLTGRLELEFTDPLTQDSPLMARGTRVVGANVYKPTCGRVALREKAGHWVAPRGCKTVSWSIEFKLVDRPSYDVSRQESFFYKGGWWFFTEFGSLLRRPGQPSSSLCTNWEGRRTCRRVPSVDRPPLFLAVGNPRLTLEIRGAFVSLYVGAEESLLPIDKMSARMSKQFVYLRALASNVLPMAPPRQFQAVWLGIDRSLGVVGGASGDDGYLANFAIVGGSVPNVERVRLLIVSGHEYMHFLGLNSVGAAWATESLASYYGYKSFVETATGADSKEAQTVIDQMSAADPYILFWSKLDEAIQARTRRERSLDQFLRFLVAGGISDGKLPSQFVSAVTATIGSAAFDRITAQYLSRNT